MAGRVWSLRIHGGVVVVPVDNGNTVVLDVTTGHQVHTLPSSGKGVHGICVFDGLTNELILLVDFLIVIILAPLTKLALKVVDTIIGPGVLCFCFAFLLLYF
jgi:hypothetical protein